MREKIVWTKIVWTLIAVLAVLVQHGTARSAATITHTLDVQPVQVCNDVGTSCTPLGQDGVGSGYLYETQVKEIWGQIGLQINYLATATFNSTAAQDLTVTERDSIYDGTFTGGVPAVPANAVQIFFVNRHSSGTDSWGSPLSAGSSSGRNAGNAQLGVTGASIAGRSVIANEGVSADSLSRTLAHEIGHILGLRHVNVTTTPDPGEPIGSSTVPNLMWAAGGGPAYDTGLNDDPMLTVLQENAHIATGQKTIALKSPFVQAIPEPSAALFSLLAVCLIGAGRWAQTRFA